MSHVIHDLLLLSRLQSFPTRPCSTSLQPFPPLPGSRSSTTAASYPSLALRWPLSAPPALTLPTHSIPMRARALPRWCAKEARCIRGRWGRSWEQGWTSSAHGSTQATSPGVSLCNREWIISYGHHAGIVNIWLFILRRMLCCFHAHTYLFLAGTNAIQLLLLQPARMAPPPLCWHRRWWPLPTFSLQGLPMWNRRGRAREWQSVGQYWAAPLPFPPL
jgi:hypothetical protein